MPLISLLFSTQAPAKWLGATPRFPAACLAFVPAPTGFGDAVGRMIIRLVHDRAVDAHLVAQIADLGDTPRAMVRYAEVTDLALLLQVADRPHRLGERRLVVFFVQVEDVDVVGAEPAQALLATLHHPLARAPAVVRPGPSNIPELGSDHPLVPPV